MCQLVIKSVLHHLTHGVTMKFTIIGVRIIKEMPGSEASGKHCIRKYSLVVPRSIQNIQIRSVGGRLNF